MYLCSTRFTVPLNLQALLGPIGRCSGGSNIPSQWRLLRHNPRACESPSLGNDRRHCGQQHPDTAKLRGEANAGQSPQRRSLSRKDVASTAAVCVEARNTLALSGPFQHASADLASDSLVPSPAPIAAIVSAGPAQPIAVMFPKDRYKHTAKSDGA
jgi:hypothetical protein